MLPSDKKGAYLGRQVTSSCVIACQRIQGFLEAYLKINTNFYE